MSQQNDPCVCSTVGSKEGAEEHRTGSKVVLQDAHKIPANAANLELQVPRDRGADAGVKGLNLT